MKILHIVKGLKCGGLENIALSLLNADIHNSYILSIDHTPEEVFRAWPMLEKFQANLFFAKKKNGFRPSVITYIRQVCKAKSISVMHTHHISPLIYGCLATFTLKHIAHIHTEHDILHLSKRKDWLVQYSLFKLKKNIHLVAVSQYVLDGLTSSFPYMDITLIHNAVDTTLFQPGDKAVARSHFNLPPTGVIIGNAGRLEMIKGHRFLIDAMEKLPSNFYLVIAGDGQLYQALLAQIQALGLLDKIILLGFVENMTLFYQACDLFCLPSLDEGLPLALLEAQSCNLPVVCSNVGGCSEAIAPGAGILVPPGDSDAIAQACLHVYDNNDNPRAFIMGNFSLPVLIASYRRLYLRALE